MLNKLHSFIRSNRMLDKGDTVICAVSGGADSVALLCVLLKYRETVDFSLKAVHINHGIRCEEAERDEAFSEACVALHSALGTYDISQNKVTFGLYARTCVYHRLNGNYHTIFKPDASSCVTEVGNIGFFVKISADAVADKLTNYAVSMFFSMGLYRKADITDSVSFQRHSCAFIETFAGYINELLCIRVNFSDCKCTRCICVITVKESTYIHAYDIAFLKYP